MTIRNSIENWESREKELLRINLFIGLGWLRLPETYLNIRKGDCALFASLLGPESLKHVLCSLLQCVYLWFLSPIQRVGLQQNLVTDTRLNSQSKSHFIFTLALNTFLVFPAVSSRAEDQPLMDRRHHAVEQPEKTSLPKKCRTKVLLLLPLFVNVVISV